jgi:adenylyltransferase/sulfurtransferase
MQMDENRYARQLVLREIGTEGQRKLFRGSVLVAGCGALGGNQAQLLVRAGVGRVRIVDRDRPEASNLPRQVLYDEVDVAAGRPKAEVSAEKLRRANSATTLEAVVAAIAADNVEELIRDVDVVLDATDNFETRYVINDVCVKLGKPWIYGGIIGTSGMSLTIRPGVSACLRCLFREAPVGDGFPTPETEGILNSAPATVGAIQATEALKLLMECEPSSDLLLVDPWNRSFRSVPVLRDEGCPCCGAGHFEFLGE